MTELDRARAALKAARTAYDKADDAVDAALAKRNKAEEALHHAHREVLLAMGNELRRNAACQIN